MNMIGLYTYLVNPTTHLIRFIFQHRNKKIFILILSQHIVTVLRTPLKMENNLSNAVYRFRFKALAIHAITHFRIWQKKRPQMKPAAHSAIGNTSRTRLLLIRIYLNVS